MHIWTLSLLLLAESLGVSSLKLDLEIYMALLIEYAAELC